MIKSIEEFTEGRYRAKSGIMYITLRRMEEKDLLNSIWKGSMSGPDNRQCEITQKGEKIIKAWLEMFIERKKLIDEIANSYIRKFGGKK